MIKKLRVIFNEEENEIGNIEKFLKIVGDKTWSFAEIELVTFYKDSFILAYDVISNSYIPRILEDVQGKEISFTEFLSKYGEDKCDSTHVKSKNGKTPTTYKRRDELEEELENAKKWHKALLARVEELEAKLEKEYQRGWFDRHIQRDLEKMQ